MEWFISKNATLPVLKMQITNNGRTELSEFMEEIELSTIVFSMIDTKTGSYKILNSEAGFVEKIFIEPNNTNPEYYLYYKFSSNETNLPGRFEGQFLLKTPSGALILPIREKLYINVLDSYIV